MMFNHQNICFFSVVPHFPFVVGSKDALGNLLSLFCNLTNAMTMLNLDLIRHLFFDSCSLFTRDGTYKINSCR